MIKRAMGNMVLDSHDPLRSPSPCPSRSPLKKSMDPKSKAKAGSFVEACRDTLFAAKDRIIAGVAGLFALVMPAMMWLLSIILSYSIPSSVKDFACWLAPDIAWASRKYRERKSVQFGECGDMNDVLAAVLASPNVIGAMQCDVTGNAMRRFTGEAQNDKFLRARHRKAREMLEVMATRPNLVTVTFACYLLRKAFRILYLFGINVDTSEVDSIRNAARKAPLVLLPTHKSHIDYLIILYVCFEHHLPIPAVVAGDNLNMWLIGWLLRQCGALFIRRTFSQDKDPLYLAVFTEYLKQLLIHGYSVEAFIEGGRSRSGKLLQPKTGVLQSVVSAVMETPGLDLYAVPIALSFDRIVETQSHVAEMAGAAKKSEQFHRSLQSIAHVMTSAASQSSTYGSVDIRFSAPISIRQYIADSGADGEGRGSERSEQAMSKWPFLYYEEDHDEDLMKYTAHTLGYRVLYECNRVSVVLPASLVATVLLSQHQRGIYREELIAKVFWLKDEIMRRRGRVVEVDVEMVDYIVTLVLGRMEGSSELVKTHNDRILLSLYKPQERMELVLLRNQLLHHFVREAIMSCCIYAKEKQTGNESEEVDVEELQLMNRFLTQLLKLEFIYRPSRGGINEHFDLTLTEMVDRGIMRFSNAERTKVSVNSVAEGDDCPGTLTYLFLCSLLWPFIDSYWLGALGLFALLPDKVVQEDVLIRRMQEFGESLYFSGMMDLYEAISRFALENAVVLLAKWRIIKIVRVEGAQNSKRAVQLSPEYQDHAKIEELVREISMYRKRSRLYRSRRFRAVHHDEVRDAVCTVLNLCKSAASRPPSPSTLIKSAI